MCKNHNHNHSKKIFKFEDFVNESKVIELLIEGNLTASDKFLKKLSLIRSNPIADTLYNAFLNKTHIDKDLSQNWVDVSDKEDVVTFMADRGASRLDNKPESIFSANRNEIKVGRFARAILTELGQTVADKDIEVFVNTYKASNVDTTKKFEMVSGKDIKKYYHEDSYSSDKGTLGDSCMRYDNCEKYFKIYTKNPKYCQLLVYLDDNGKVLGRALVWKLKKKKLFNIKDQSKYDCPAIYFMDRVYTTSDSDVVKFTNLAKEKGWLYKWKMTADTEQGLIFRYNDQILFGQITVELDKVEFRNYPFFDTLSFCDGDSYISNVGLIGDDAFTMCSTEGESEPCCDCDGDGYDKDNDGDCRACSGSGNMDDPKCGGMGQEICIKCDGDGSIVCKKCNGDGSYDCPSCSEGDINCVKCGGNGYKECSVCKGTGDGDHCTKCKDGTLSCSECGGKPVTCKTCKGSCSIVKKWGVGKRTVSCPDCGGLGVGLSGPDSQTGCRCDKCSCTTFSDGSWDFWRNTGVVDCEECDGLGTLPCIECKDKEGGFHIGCIECEVCDGNGSKPCEVCKGNRSYTHGSIECEVCKGNGSIGECDKCKGSGSLGKCKNPSCDNGKVTCLLCNGKGEDLRTGKILCPSCTGLLDIFKEDLKCGIFTLK